MCSIRPTAFKIAGNFPEVSSSGEYTSQIHTLETAAIAGQLVCTTQAACIPQTAHALQAKFTTSSSNPAYTPSILTFVGSPEETTYYQSLHLQEWCIGSYHSLIRPINWRADNYTNITRVCSGHSPIDHTTGQTIELHHIGQRNNSPLAELTVSEHRGKTNDLLLHTNPAREPIDRNAFRATRRQYWLTRLLYDLTTCHPD